MVSVSLCGDDCIVASVNLLLLEICNWSGTVANIHIVISVIAAVVVVVDVVVVVFVVVMNTVIIISVIIFDLI